MDIRCDLRRELNQYAESHMSELGYKYNRNHKLSTFQQYMNIMRREVSPRPRKVLISKHLICPPQHRNGFDYLIQALESGKNVNTHLSSELKNASYSDGFLNDFGLHHFHLGERTLNSGKSKGCVERTGPILIAYVKDEYIFLIGIFNHGKGGDEYLWTDQKVIEIIHNEWPKAIEHFKVTMFESLSNNPTPEERMNLRKSTCNSFTQMPDGTAYAPIGGGLTAANTSLNVTLDYLKYIRYSSSMLAFLCKSISERIHENTHFPITLKLISLSGGYIYEDRKNKTIYFLHETPNKKVRFIAYRKRVFPEHYPSDSFPIAPIAEGVLKA